MNSKDVIGIDNENSYKNKINLLAKALKDSDPNEPELLLAVEDYIKYKNVN